MDATLIIFSGLPGAGKMFLPWRSESALFVEGAASVDENFARVVEYVMAEMAEDTPGMSLLTTLKGMEQHG